MCNFPNCTGDEDIHYMGKYICKQHWNQLCNIYTNNDIMESGIAQIAEEENKLLREIDLYRDEDGMVYSIKKDPLTNTE